MCGCDAVEVEVSTFSSNEESSMIGMPTKEEEEWVATQGKVIRKILRHLKLAAAPPSMTPACACQEAFGWSYA